MWLGSVRIPFKRMNSESINLFNLDRETSLITSESNRSILLLEYVSVTTISKIINIRVFNIYIFHYHKNFIEVVNIMQIYILIILTLFFIRLGVHLKTLDKTDGWSAQKLYEEARSELNVGNYETAVSVYQKLSSRFLFGKYAQQGSLDIAYAH